MRKIIGLALSLGLLLGIGVGCGKTEDPASNALSQTQSAETQKGSTESKVIKIGVDASYRPMEYQEDGKTKGFSYDLINAICTEINVKAEYHSVDWDSIFNKLYAKEFDLITSSLTITDERKKTMLFSDPYFESEAVILTKTGKGIKSCKDFSGKKVIIQKDTTSSDIIKKNIPGVQFLEFNLMPDAFKYFENGDADILVSDSPVVYYYAKQKNNPAYEVLKDSSIFTKESFGIAANIGDDKTIAEMNKGLAIVKGNGTYKKIYDKYFATEK
jgi:polar amino acid transport system substrate-binding protein